MITLFTTAKPFLGHDAVIQRNALQSWTLLHPDIEVILFGDDEGAAEVARELGIRHEPHVERNEFGLKRIDYYFDRAQEIARHDVLCYVNCDILLMKDFCNAIQQVQSAHSEFLMVGRRWDTEIAEPIAFSSSEWATDIRKRAAAANDQRDAWWIDYFVFSRELYLQKIPPLVIGRVGWDNWLIWYALNAGVAVIDASKLVTAVHQNHGYGYHPLGKDGVWHDEQAQRNFKYAGGWNHMRTIADATELLTTEGLRSNNRRHWGAIKRIGGSWGRALRFKVWNPVWFAILHATRPIRHALGLRARRKV